MRELADGRGLARAVHADDEDGVGLDARIYDERLGDGREQCSDVAAQSRKQGIDISELLPGHALAQTLEQFFGDLHPHVRGQQPRLEFFEDRLVDPPRTEKSCKARTDSAARSREAIFQSLEKAGF